MEGCDTLLMVGTSFPYSEWLPEEGQAQVRADRPRRPARRHALSRSTCSSSATRRRRCASCCRCSSARRIAAGARRSRSRSPSGGGSSRTARMHGRRSRQPAARLLGAVAAAARRTRSSPPTPARRRTGGRGMLKLQARQCWRRSPARSRRWGPGVPYAIAAKFAYPGAPGDRDRRRRRDPDERHERADHGRSATRERFEGKAPLVVCVFNNQDLNQVTWEQRALTGDPKYPGTQGLPDFDYARYAELRRACAGIACDDPDARRRTRGTRRSRPTGPSCSRRSSTRRSRRCRRTSARAGEEDRRRRWSKGDPNAVGVMEKSAQGQARRSSRSRLPGSL